MRLLFCLTFAAICLSVGIAAAQQAPHDPPRCPYNHPREDCATTPRGTYTPEPEYSDHARRKRIQGTVLLSITIQPDGSVGDARITRSLEKSLDKQALAAVRTWRFEPSMYEGKPIAYTTEVEVSFHLR